MEDRFVYCVDGWYLTASDGLDWESDSLLDPGASCENRDQEIPPVADLPNGQPLDLEGLPPEMAAATSYQAGPYGVAVGNRYLLLLKDADTNPTLWIRDFPTQDDVIAGLFEIGDGRSLFIRCEGNGSPTVLLEAGDNSDTRQWAFVQPALAEVTRTCAYDRSGLGQSDPASGCRGLDDLLGDLESLLRAADIDGPYVLVGTSGGGFLMAGFGARHPEDVAGLVLVETPKALNADLYPEVIDLIRCDAPDNVERRDYLKVEHAVWDNRAEIGDFPMVIVTNDWGPGAERDEATNVEDQRGWMVLSPNSSQVVVTSGHDVAENEPDLVVNEILSVVASSR